jgi:hypothetical protein
LSRLQQQVNPDKLRMLGKQASTLHVRDGVPLTEAVVGVLRDEQGLTPDHVKRVIEFSNNDAFQILFEKEAGGHKVINFNGGPANPSEVLRELNMAAIPTPVAVSNNVGNYRPFVPGQDSAEIDDPFGRPKTASKNYRQLNPSRDIEDLRGRLVTIRDNTMSKLSSLGVLYDDAETKLYQEVRQLVLDGMSPAAISTAISKVASTREMTQLALKQIHTRMESDRLPSVAMVKTASGLVNTRHPLIQAFRDFEKVAEQRYTFLAALDIVDNELRKVNKSLARGVVE